ncbi:hypothetical protein ACTXJ9_10990 [Brachybacterium tyrofermentans]|uniref:hypothetical protein n=1 Tax=Brachybacterium tyrofermentans TaxID=47848 RepID=UPI003FD40BC2
MSKCISSHGEYSDHEPGDPCPYCGEYDTARIIAERDQAKARIQAARELHQPHEDKECGTVCDECSYFGGDYGLYPTDYPCDTLLALNEAPALAEGGEQS